MIPSEFHVFRRTQVHLPSNTEIIFTYGTITLYGCAFQRHFANYTALIPAYKDWT